MLTRKQYGKKVGKGDQWVSAAIRLGKVKADKFNNSFAIPENEVDKFKKNPFTISRKEMQQ